MSYAYLLAGEDLELAEAELKGFLESQEAEEEIDREVRIAIASEVQKGQLRRLALTHEVSEVIGRHEIDEETEWCHWIKYANADRVCIRTTNRYVSGFSVSPASTRLVDATLAPETFQLYLAGVDVDGEPIGGDQTDFSDFTGGASA